MLDPALLLALLVAQAPAPTPTPAPPALAPPAAAAAPDVAPAPRALPTPLPEYQIGAEDILRITVQGHDDLNQTVVVQQDGTFIYPLIGRVKASDMTPKELERKITILLARGFIRNPQVTVLVQEYRSKTVLVMGEVARPGPYPVTGSMRVVEMLAKAGATTSAGTEVVIVRPLSASEGPILPSEVVPAADGGAPPDATSENAPAAAPKQADILRVNIRDIQAGDLDKNILLQPNDTVFVPPAAKFFVSGEVRSPGAYPLTSVITVREAIIIAGGFGDNAATGRIRVVREVEGKKRELKIKLDDPVQPGDTIVVKAKLF
jgi:polysaccharide export outer membrane protein